LTLIERESFFNIIKVRTQYNTGQRDLFDDLISVCKDNRNPESLGEFRNFTYANEDEDDWLTCGFINYAEVQNSSIS
jgi:hypothetical protein